MGPSDGVRPVGRVRRVLALAAFAVALMVGGMFLWRLWPPGRIEDGKALGLLRAALDEFNAGRHERALALLDRRSSEARPTALDWMLRARVAEARGRLEEALGHLKHISDSDPIAPNARLKAGQIEMKRHHARDAEAAFRHALMLQPVQAQSRRELACLYALQRRKAECDEQFRALAKLAPMDYVLAFAWAQTDYEIWDPKEAITILASIVAACPDDRRSRLALASSYREADRFEEAEAALAPLSGADPDARALRVAIAFDRGDVEAGEGLLRDGPADCPPLNVFRGRMALRTHDWERAAAWFRAAIREAPDDRDALHGLGSSLQRLGAPGSKELLQCVARRDELRRTIIACGSSKRFDSRVFARLGQLYESLGRREQARVWYRLALEWAPLDKPASEGLARLDRAAPEALTNPAP